MVKKRKYFGTDGIRGTVGQAPITPDFCLHLGWAVGKVFAKNGNGQVLIGKDARISGYMLEAVLESGLTSAGTNVSLLGVIPTPAVAYLTRTMRADAGIVISASHNPYYDNGIKFFDHRGNKLDDETELAIEAELSKKLECVPSQHLGKAQRVEDKAGRYIEFCKATVDRNLRLKGLRIVVDCANGATYEVAPAVFEELGADVIAIGNKPDGLNINDNCGSTYPDSLKEKVLATRADIGIAFDGDGDRVIMVNGKGKVIDGDGLLHIIANHRAGNDTLGGGVVGTVMTNFGLERSFAEAKIPFVRAQVGDRYVLEELRQRNWLLGGESSGHLLCLDLTTTGDAIVSALQVLTVMVETGKNIDELGRGFEPGPQHMINVKVKDPHAVANNPAVAKEVTRVEKALGDQGRVLIRPSGTEPVVRVMVEASDEVACLKYTKELAEVVATENKGELVSLS